LASAVVVVAVPFVGQASSLSAVAVLEDHDNGTVNGIDRLELIFKKSRCATQFELAARLPGPHLTARARENAGIWAQVARGAIVPDSISPSNRVSNLLRSRQVLYVWNMSGSLSYG